MPETVAQVRGDSRTEELAARNMVEIPPVPAELEDWAKANPVYIFNVSSERFIIEHPLMGKLTIKPCAPGEDYSEPTVIPGLIPYGVRVEMQTAELRHESGRQFAVDIIGIGAFKDIRASLWSRGVFIAAQDTFDPAVMETFKLGKARISLPSWVNLRKGKCSPKPTKKEVADAQERVAKSDFAKIAEADRYYDAGPANKEEGSGNITIEHKLALRRRNQIRDWDKPQQTLIDCPGCGTKVPPTMIVHTACGYVFDWDKAVSSGMKKAEDRPKK